MESELDRRVAGFNRIIIIVSSIVAFSIFIAGVSSSGDETSTKHVQYKPTNVIFMLGDGFGPAEVTLARIVRGGSPLPQDPHLSGTVRTLSNSSWVTDSAAGITAYSCAHKTFNGAIGVDEYGVAIANLAEVAKKRGMAVGLVATSPISHATPAGFSAHVASRNDYEYIAAQQANSSIDLFIGGGAKWFVSRSDNVNLLDAMERKGYKTGTTLSDFDSLDSTPAIVLLADENMEYEIDRNPSTQPSVAEMAQKAIDVLSKHKGGFLLLIEGSRIDHGGHANDPQANAHDAIAFGEAFERAKAFVESHGDDSTLVSVADHETGGLGLGRDGQYKQKPEVLAAMRTSSIRAAERIRVRLAGMGWPTGSQDIADVVNEEMTGLTPNLTVSECNTHGIIAVSNAGSDANALSAALSRAVSARAFVAWTTTGHTGVDINMYSAGKHASLFRGNMDNTEVGKKLFDILGVEHEVIAEINEHLKSEVDPNPTGHTIPSPSDGVHIVPPICFPPSPCT